jgi:hypothetical protein
MSKGKAKKSKPKAQKGKAKPEARPIVAPDVDLDLDLTEGAEIAAATSADGIPPSRYEIPEHLRFSKLLKRKKLSKDDLAQFKEKMLLLHAPEALRLAFQGLLSLAHKEDLGAIKLLLEVFGYIERKGGINVTQQVVATSQSGTTDSFDSIVRRLYAARNGGRQVGPMEAMEARYLESARSSELSTSSSQEAVAIDDA